MPAYHSDRRRDPRVTVWSPLSLETDHGRVEATLRNLSLAGVCCTAREEFPEMTRIQVVLELPTGDDEQQERPRLSLEGVVVRCKPLRRGSARRRFELAIFFPEMDDPTKSTLTNYVHRRTDALTAAPDK